MIEWMKDYPSHKPTMDTFPPTSQHYYMDQLVVILIYLDTFPQPSEWELMVALV